MPDWDNLLLREFESNHSGEDYTLVLGLPCSAEDLEAFRVEMGLPELPAEFVDFYSACNGTGLSDEAGHMVWMFVPIDLLPEFVQQIRVTFAETHPEWAARFLPFFDWGTGDGIGYLWPEGGGAPVLVEFEQAGYESRADQPPEEFLLPGPESIEQFIIDMTD